MKLPKGLVRICGLGLLILAAALFAGCEYSPFGYTPIKEIVANPTVYEGKEVKVKGRVQEVTKIPFIEPKFYTLVADGYSLPVLTDQAIPAVDTEVVVIGRLENIAIIGSQSIGMHIREIKRVDKPIF
jgi:hypothetical protein